MSVNIRHQGSLDGDAIKDMQSAFSNQQMDITAITADGAVNPNVAANYLITKATACLLSFAAPVAGVASATPPGSDGIKIRIFSANTAQHVLTFTGNILQSGASGVLTATFPAAAGGALELMCYNGKYMLLSNNLVVIT